MSLNASILSKNVVKVIINRDNENTNEFVDVIWSSYQVSELKEFSVRRLIGTHMRFVLCRGLPEGKYPISGDRRRENYKSGELHNELHITSVYDLIICTRL